MNELNRFQCDFFQARPGVLPADNADDLSNQGVSIDAVEAQETLVQDGPPLDSLEGGGVDDLSPATPLALPPG